MKLAIAISTAGAPAQAFVVFRGIEESIARAAALGYGGIELAVATPADAEPARLDKWLGGHNMEVSAVSTGLVFASRGLSLLGTPQKAQRAFFEIIDLAADYGHKVNIGRSRGFMGAGTFEETAETFKKTLGPLSEYAAKKKVQLLIEPVNRYEIDWIHSLDEGAALLDLLGFDNLRLMPDTFHMNIEDSKLPDKLAAFGSYLSYIHLADSNRLAPGQGHIDFPAVFAALKSRNYDDWASVEILPLPSPEAAAKQAIDFLKPLLEIYNRNNP
jgi:sugar phosphate isomerase/epimerase